jgi:hypothetical protein
LFDATDHCNEIASNSSCGIYDCEGVAVKSLIFGYLYALSISIEALNMFLRENPIFDCPEQTHTSPNKTSFNVIVSIVPLANGRETMTWNGPSSGWASSVIDQIESPNESAADRELRVR